jgi:hypothetical protein
VQQQNFKMMLVLPLALLVILGSNQLFYQYVVDVHINAVHVLVVFYVVLVVVDIIYQELHV